jgi:hypothetical protein
MHALLHHRDDVESRGADLVNTLLSMLRAKPPDAADIQAFSPLSWTARQI